MSDMHYIEKFANAQLQQAINNGMRAHQLTSLVHALKAEADALTPGGGYIVAYAAKNMGLVEQSPSEGNRPELQNAYLTTCVTGYSRYHLNVIFADRLSRNVLEDIESDLRELYGRHGNCFYLVSIIPLGLVDREGFQCAKIPTMSRQERGD
ncbi:hypothetical protein [Aeromonas jandaei]|uniref:hypothetical protein n=1 Tax=Aeromonas jandaei TaxID=650 RepID=UPI001ADD6A88|nr:hypothetical protein [Aeromonas jandaei]QTL95549.1 hypothetical protein AjGTCBM29_03468 [Aeromonas jandaei]